MAVSTYLLSFIVRQYTQLGDAFPAKFQHSWLVWEPGVWRPAKTVRDGKAKTMDLRAHAEPARPRGTDAFCFHLDVAPGKQLSLGRTEESDILVNDLSLSRTHLLLRANPGWQASVAPSCSRTTTHGGQPVGVGDWHTLPSGIVVGCGEVKLSFYDVGGMLERLAAEARRAQSAA